MGLNDPQWGNKNGGGPPDLEEVLRNLNHKIESLFGKSGGGAPKGGGNKSGGIASGIWSDRGDRRDDLVRKRFLHRQ